MHYVTDGQTDDVMMPRADHTACSTIGYKKAMLSQREPRDAAVNFDTCRLLQ